MEKQLLQKISLKKYFFEAKKIFLLLLVAFAFFANAYAQENTYIHKQAISKWSTNPFEQKVFVENKTQFDGKDNLPNSSILFGVRSDGLQIYFTPTGLTYRHDETVKMSEKQRDKYEKEGKEAELMQTTTTSCVNLQWLNSNPDVQIVPENPVSNYFTYGDLRDKSGKTTITAIAYKKIIYKNLYPNIDVEYTFPEGKEGIKYAIILHPGADASVIKMKYSDNVSLSKKNENMVIKSSLGEILDHQPISTYSTGENIFSSFKINSDHTISFQMDNYDHSKTVVIDPWVTTPTFAGSSSAYDVDCDLFGNVYIYGGTNPFQESKLNSAGTILWTYTATPLSADGYYGDFAVDGHSENSYLVEGFNPGTGANIVKISATGVQIALFAGNPNMIEMWRIVYNNCTHTSVIAGGGTSVPYQACVLDSNLAAITPVNILSATTALHDFALLAQDNVGNCYMATAKSVSYPTVFDNMMMKAPIPALLPTAYKVSDGYTFEEVGSVTYVPQTPNGFNGMAVSPNFLYTYDGAVLKKWNSATGALLASVTVTANSFQCGGLQVDDCDHIFVGASNTIKQYDVNLNLVSTIAVSSTVYDLKLGQGGLLYACGLGFVQSLQVTLAPCSAFSLTMTSTSACSATNTATVTASGGVSPYTYSWSTIPSQTTATATGLSAGKYYVTVTDNSCVPLTQKDSITIVAGSSMTFTTSSTTSNCSNATGTATVTPSGGTPAYTYGWTPGGQTTQTATGLSAGTYAVAVTDGTGCVKDTTVIVLGIPAIAITITPSPITICAGSSATLTGSGGTTYLWSTGSTANPLVISPAATTTYTVTGTTGGCTGTATVLITVDPTMVLGTTTTSATCGNNDGSTTVAISSGGTAPYTYSWAPGGSTATNVTALAAGTYSVTVTDGNGCTQTATAVVPNAGGPAATIGTVTNVTCFGAANGSIAVTASAGVIPYTYSWSPGGQTTATATALSPGAYTLTVTDANGCSITATASITQPTALDTTTNYVNILCNGGTNGSATINVTGGTGAYTYVWTPNVSTTGAATALGAGTYSVIVNDANGCSISKTFVLTQPSLLKASAGGFSATCFGTCNGYAVVIPSGGTAPYTYSWTPSGSITANANNLCAGNYCIKLTDANGCNVDTCVTVSQPTILALNTTTTTANCNQADGSATVNATGGTGAYTYLWAPGGQTTATATAITAGTYTVTVTDGNSCTQTATAVVPNAPGVVASIASSTNDACFGTCDGTATSLATSGTAPYNYSWNTVPAQTTAGATGLCAGTYTVTITDATGCSNTASVTITQPTQITVSPSAATTICIGQSTILSANAAGGTPAYTYSWNNTYNGQDYTVSPTTTPTTYTVVVTDADGCISAPQTVVVNLNPPLAVIAKNDTSLCLGGHASLSASGSGGNGTYNYAWQPGALSGSPISVTPNTTTIYTVTVTDNCGTPPATNTVTVTVNPLPVVSFSADTVSGCYPLCVTFTNLSTPASTAANWEFGDGNTANTIATASNCYQAPGSYNVTLSVTDNLGCSNSATLNDMITVYPHPTANFSMSPQPVTIMNPTVSFKDLSTGTITQWEWNLGDVPNSASSLQNPQYTYPDTGYYNVQLIVTNNFGCTDSITKTVYIEGQFVIYVPNAFTPNGDGINDTFYPKGTGIDPNNYQMYIFDRWGNMLFYTTSLNQGWNGKVEGDSQLVQEDVYVWKIICKDFLGNNHQYIGHVSVVR